MSWQKIFLTLLLFLFLSSSPLLRREYYLESTPQPVKKLKLLDNFIEPGSLSLFIGDSLLPKDLYSLDLKKGEVYLSCSLPPGVPIKVSYFYFPFKRLKPEYLRYELKEEEETIPHPAKGEVSPFKDNDTSFSGDGEEIHLQGSKLLGFNYSNEGFALEQATDVKLSGKAGDFELELFLQDKNLPRFGEEQTLELRELEGVSLTISRFPYRFTFGDLLHLSPFGNFGQVRRKGQGLKLEGNPEGGKFFFAYLKPKNKFGVVEFSGEDGKKGPYLLTAEGKRVVVITGSEEVYLNGEKKRRGEREDYTINYATGELTFTNRVLINSQSRVEVRFLYQAEDYERDGYSLYGEKNLFGGYLKGFFSNLLEKDDKTNNLLFPLSPEERRYLATIGDDTSKAFLPSERYVGKNKGDYKKENGVFVYCGKDSGDYEVTFLFVGEGKGEYIYDNEINGYRYLGPGLGQWTPKKKITLPQERIVSSLGIALFPSSPFNLSAQGIWLKEDRNTFSHEDDGDNLGLGYNILAQWEKEKISLALQREGYLKNYHLLEEENQDFFYTWGVRRDSVKGLTQLFGKFSPFPFFRWDWTGGLSEKGKNFKRRFSSSFQLFFFAGGIEYLAERKKFNFSLRPKISFLQPTFSFQSERYDTSLISTSEPNLILTFPQTELDFGWEEIQWRKREGNFWTLAKRQRRLKGGGNFSFKFLHLSLLLGQERMRNFQIGGERRQFFAEGEISFPDFSFLKGNWEGKILHKGIEEKEVQYLKVEEGRGDYKKDPNTGNYFYHPKGDYIRVFIPTGKIIPARELNLNSYLFLQPHKKISAELNLTRTEAVSEANESHSENENYLLNLTYYPLSYLHLRLGKNYNSFSDQNLTLEGEREIIDKNSFTIENDFGENWRVAPGVEINRQEKERNTLTRRSLEKKGKVAIFFGLPLDIELNFALGEIFIQDFSPSDSFKIIKGEWGLARSLTLFDKVGVNLTFDLTHRKSEDNLPYDLLLTEPIGWTYGAGIEINSNPKKNLNLSFQYQIRKDPIEKLDQILNGSARINF